MWQRKVRWSPYNYQVLSSSYVIQMTGGSITIMDRPSMSVLERHTGHKALYTGDIHPDESVCAALEYGKHFYVYSLKTFELLRRVTLPRCFESIDLDCRYSSDGQLLLVRAKRWVQTGNCEGYNEYVMLLYRTDDYSLTDRLPLDDPEAFCWKQFQLDLEKRREVIP